MAYMISLSPALLGQLAAAAEVEGRMVVYWASKFGTHPPHPSKLTSRINAVALTSRGAEVSIPCSGRRRVGTKL